MCDSQVSGCQFAAWAVVNPRLRKHGRYIAESEAQRQSEPALHRGIHGSRRYDVPPRCSSQRGPGARHSRGTQTNRVGPTEQAAAQGPSRRATPSPIGFRAQSR
jgi:hypothetical protein